MKKSYAEFPYITLRRVIVYLIAILATEVLLVFTYFAGDEDKKSVLLLMYLVPVGGVWLFVTKYILYDFWYIRKIRTTGVAYIANVVTGIRRGGLDPTAPYATELKRYNVTYAPNSAGHVTRRFAMLMGLLFGFIFLMSTTFILLHLLGIVS